MAKAKVLWDLTKPLPSLRINDRVVVKTVGKDQLIEVGKILVTTWGARALLFFLTKATRAKPSQHGVNEQSEHYTKQKADRDRVFVTVLVSHRYKLIRRSMRHHARRLENKRVSNEILCADQSSNRLRQPPKETR